MPTPQELDQYGAGLSIWEQIRLFQEWSPLIGYAQQLLNEPDSYKKSLVVASAAEWVASKTKATSLDDELITRLAAILRTKEGEDLVRWGLSKVEAK